MAFNCTITVNAGKTPNAQGNFVWLANTANFPTSAVDGGASSILNGGGNLRCYTDNTKATRLPLDVVSFATGASPSIKVFGLSPSLNVSSTVYIEADEAETSQPAFSAAFGRNATWVNDKKVYHLLESTGSTAIDSCGNSNATYTGSLPTLGANFGQELDGNGDFVEVDATAIDFSSFTFSAKIKTDTLSGNHQIYTQDRGNSPAVRTWQWRLAGNKIQIICWDLNGSIFINTAGSISLSAGVEYIVSFSFDGDNYKTFIDGVVDLNIANTSIIRNLQSLGPVIGANNTSSEEWDGEIGQLVDRNGAFKSDDFITSEYNNQSDPSTFWSTSSWTDSGGITVTADISFNIDSAGFNSSASASLPQPVSNVSFNILVIELSSSGTATLPNPSAAASFNINSLSIDSSASVTLPQPASNILFNIASVGINSTASATEQGFNANVAFNIDSIVFASSVTVTLPQPIANSAFNVGYSVFASGNATGVPTHTIGTVTASFAPDLYKPQFKASEITVKFKS